MLKRLARALVFHPVPFFVVACLASSVFTGIYWFFHKIEYNDDWAMWRKLSGLAVVLAVILVSVVYPWFIKSGRQRWAFWLVHGMSGLLMAMSTYFAFAPIYVAREGFYNEVYIAICSRDGANLGVVRGNPCNFIGLMTVLVSDRMLWVRLYNSDVEYYDSIKLINREWQKQVVDISVRYQRSLRLECLDYLYVKTNRDVGNCLDDLSNKIRNAALAVLSNNPDADPNAILLAVRALRDNYFDISNISVEIDYSSRLSVEYK